MIIKKILFLLILILIFCPGISRAEDRRSNKTYYENMLINCSGIVVDSDENIYLGNGFFGKIQVYNNQGIYMHSINLNTSGSFTMSMENDFLYVAIARRQKVLAYDKEGFIIDEKQYNNSDIFKEFREKNSRIYNGKRRFLLNYKKLWLYFSS